MTAHVTTTQFASRDSRGKSAKRESRVKNLNYMVLLLELTSLHLDVRDEDEELRDRAIGEFVA